MKVRLFLRSFLIQGLWNYRTMLGSGLAWVLLPVLRRAAGDNAEETTGAMARQARHFNAHPYLSGFAVGALARMELDGEGEDVIDRFRSAVAAPLGGLGDRLIWAAWLPACAVLAGVLGLLGLHPLGAVCIFLLSYNAVHLPLRWWGLTAGLAQGRGVGQALGRGRLPLWAERVGRPGVLLVGLLVGTLTAPERHVAFPDVFRADMAAVFALVAVVLFSIGAREQRGRWWWTPALILATFLVFLGWGGLPG